MKSHQHNRPQSPFARSAHPGAVLLSPSSTDCTTTNNNTTTNGTTANNSNGYLSPNAISMSQQGRHTPVYINDLLDQQQPFSLDDNTSSSLSNLHQQIQIPQPMPMQNRQPLALQPHQPMNLSTTSPGPGSNNNNNNNNNSLLLSSSSSITAAAGSVLLSPTLRVHSPTPQYIDTNSIFQYNTDNNVNSNINNNTNTNTNDPIHSLNQDIQQVCSWVQGLNSVQQNSFIENLLPILNDEVLQFTNLKLQSVMNSNGNILNNNVLRISSSSVSIENNNNNDNNNKYTSKDDDPSSMSNLHSLFIDTNTNNNNNLYRPWSPQPTSNSQPSFDYNNNILNHFDLQQRPKSADPHILKKSSPRFNNNNSNNHLHPNSFHHNYNKNNNSNNHNYHNNYPQNINTSQHNNNNQKHTPQKKQNLPNNNNNSRDHQSPVNNSSMTPESLTDPELLSDTLAWLKSLRLHKYSDVLNGLPWYELIYLDDKTLEEKGVSALGARRKLLKAFAIVKDCKENNLIDKSAYD